MAAKKSGGGTRQAGKVEAPQTPPAHDSAQADARASQPGACNRPLDDSIWPPRHDGIRCHGWHAELPAPPRHVNTNALPEVTDARQKLFLEALAATGNISQSCRITNCGRSTYYGWLKDDPAFVTHRDMAIEIYADSIHEEMHARGIDGWDEPVVGRIGKDQDGIVTYVRKKDTQVLLALARGAMPEKYGKQLHDVRGKDGQPLAGDLSALSDEELAVYRALVMKVSAGKEQANG